MSWLSKLLLPLPLLPMNRPSELLPDKTCFRSSALHKFLRDISLSTFDCVWRKEAINYLADIWICRVVVDVLCFCQFGNRLFSETYTYVCVWALKKSLKTTRLIFPTSFSNTIKRNSLQKLLMAVPSLGALFLHLIKSGIFCYWKKSVIMQRKV